MKFQNLILTLSIGILFSACTNSTKEISDYQSMSGRAQGTSYHLTYKTVDGAEVKQSEIDRIIEEVDLSLSTYRKDSYISKVNSNTAVGLKADTYFVNTFNLTKDVYELTDGALEPTISPLLQLWGFDLDNQQRISPTSIDSALALVNFKSYSLSAENELVKTIPNSILNFNALAQGYTVDVIGDYLESLGVQNYMFELGGELKVLGQNPKNENWNIGIDKPSEDIDTEDRFQHVVALESGNALATSGSYRQFRVDSLTGKKYPHILSPFDGKPVQHSLLSVSVTSKSCAMADGLSTAFMVLGSDKTKSFLEKNPELQLGVLMIYQGPNGDYVEWANDRFQKQIKK